MRRLLVALALAPGLAVPLSAAPPFGGLAGVVQTIDHRPVPQVQLVFQGQGSSRTALSGPGGRYRLTDLPPGSYHLRVELPGFVLASPDSVDVWGRPVAFDVVLGPAPVREHVLVTATRAPAAASSLGVSATVLEGDRVAAAEPTGLLHVLQDVPGVAVARTGGIGRQGSVFIRGGESRFARVLLDGIPVNEPGGFQNLGSELPLEIGRVEVVRGAASSLYGTDALAGAIQIVTRRAEPGEAPSLRGAVEAGRFDWRRFEAGSSGSLGRLDWNAGVERLTTDNQVPNAAFAETAGAASLGLALDPRTSLRMVLRAESSDGGTPGQTLYGRPDRDASYARSDLVAGLHLRHDGRRISQELRVGLSRTRQLSLDPEDSGSYRPRLGERIGAFDVADFPNPLGFQNDTGRGFLGYQAEAEAGRHLLTLGLDLERETGALGDRREDLLRPARTNFGLFLQDRVVAAGRLFVTLGGRVEHNASYGTAAVPRVAVAYWLRPGESATILKASAGIGIKEPGFFESYGVSFFAHGNPDLSPERSRTVDAGVEQRLFGSRLRVEATFFRHEYRDQIAYQLVDPTTFEGTYVNLGRTRARGLELALEAAPFSRLRLRAEYTFLDGRILEAGDAFDPVYAAGESLLRRPRHQASLGAEVEGGVLSGGARLLVVGERTDSDFLGLGLTRNPGYLVLDAHLRANLGHGLIAFAAGENLLDRAYQEALGYPALRRSLRVGLRYRVAP